LHDEKTQVLAGVPFERYRLVRGASRIIWVEGQGAIMQDPDPPKTLDAELLRRLNEIAFRKLRAFTKRFAQLQEHERSFQENSTRIRHRRQKNRD